MADKDKENKKPEDKQLSMAGVSDDALAEELQKRRAKNRWVGKGGLWSTFRAIGRTFYNDKALTTEQKKAKLVEEIKTFVDERLA